ncbi:uncharacterized protein LOC142531815 [Primulina tabacum]|uniref:uncharacterized protein LOC142531815 n=1 Tax=Primulina tabacum TaxID=48773 RepID=UPI003F59DFDF
MFNHRSHSKGLMKAVYFKRPGSPDVLRVKEVRKPIIERYEVMVKVVATGVNIHDVLYRRNAIFPRFALNAYLGDECSGIIVAVGSRVSNFKEGDEVCAILANGGGYAEFVAIPASQVVKIPSGVSLMVAATLPLATCLSFYGLSILTKVTPGKIVLIHGVADGIGIIALQYAKNLGCKVFAVAETEENLRLYETLGSEVCINYEKEDCCKRVKAETKEKGMIFLLFKFVYCWMRIILGKI